MAEPLAQRRRAAGDRRRVLPVLAAAATATLVWLLRGGSLAASSVGDRRRLRGRRWYDGPRLLLGAPWHLVRSLPGTLGLLLWATGAAAAAGLVCYAVATDEPTTLAACATAATLGLWWGPGSDRVRSPLARVLRPACATGGGWVVAVAAAGLVAGLAAYLAVGGADWTPLAERPLGDLSLPF